ncbi:hypothetical protein [Bradyrhizobium semiaridum]|uniref:hypothetical protein n=1 Tax=Bradyrhizobium semiaridum TaxID=2821404 RepID=UPI001CE3449A|nr:hypothetical protein [Bradyrhizobium semiaridum]
MPCRATQLRISTNLCRVGDTGQGGTSVAETLHRIEERTLKRDIEVAGFKLVAEADFLHHPEDPRDIPVFKAPVPIDEFVLKYQKPQ